MKKRAEKRPRDVNHLARFIVEQVTGEPMPRIPDKDAEEVMRQRAEAEKRKEK